MNPAYVTQFNLNSFLCYTDKSFAAKVGGITCRFQSVIHSEYYPGDDFKALDMLCVRSDMMAMKGQRVPGKQKI